MSNKEIAKSFLKMAASGDVQNAYDRFVAPNFIHHNQYFKGDRQTLVDAMKEASQKSPNKSFEIKHVYEDGNTVIAHSCLIKENPEVLVLSVVHIFRFENGKIAEFWDIAQQILKDSPNENGMF
jgi:predicted SnoaL-like aldol condensation-catalyzing enzyme